MSRRAARFETHRDRYECWHSWEDGRDRYGYVHRLAAVAWGILEGLDDPRLFDRQVMGKLVLSDGMKERSETWSEIGTLSVNLVSPEDIFLFKAVATRPDDIGDMQVLAETGLDFHVIEQELEVQVDLLDDIQFVTYVGEALGELADQHGVTPTKTVWCDPPLSIDLKGCKASQYTTRPVTSDVSRVPDSALHRIQKF